MDLHAYPTAIQKVAHEARFVGYRNKIPFDAETDLPARVNDPSTWSTLAGAVCWAGRQLGHVGVVALDLVVVDLDGAVAGGAPGTSTLRLWSARLVQGEPVAHEHRELRWVTAGELDALDWIPADRPLLPAVRGLLTGP